MKSVHRVALSTAIILLFLAGLCSASVVTLDVASKSANADDPDVNPGGIKVVGSQVGLVVNSTITQPQSFTLRVNGLTEPAYDVWTNSKLLSTKTAKELEAGIELRIDGRITDANMMRCLTKAKPLIKVAAKRLQASKDPEERRVYNTLTQADGWVTGSTNFEQAWRSVRVILAPAGRALQRMSWGQRRTDVETADGVTKACWLLQQARARMFGVIKNPTLRNDAVVAMTPVDFNVRYTNKNGKPGIEAEVVNNTDLPISGTISMALPKDWKCTAKSLKITSVEPGKTFRLTCPLAAASKDAAPPDSVPIAANLTIVRDQFSASFRLRQIAAMELSCPPHP